jgi:D-glycero-D-manno-heptose 1,7-bisphosphate phosphatase
MTVNKAIFIDKDGTLVKDIPYNVDPALVILNDNAVQGLQDLKRAGYCFFLISNQSGVALDLFKIRALNAVEEKIAELLRPYDICITAFYFCPHHPEGIVTAYRKKCNCRKPQPGLIMRAAREYHIDLSKSWMIGDILDDVEAGNLAGCKTVLLNNGNETEWMMHKARTPDYIVADINEAAACILALTADKTLA